MFNTPRRLLAGIIVACVIIATVSLLVYMRVKPKADFIAGNSTANSDCLDPSYKESLMSSWYGSRQIPVGYVAHYVKNGTGTTATFSRNPDDSTTATPNTHAVYTYATDANARKKHYSETSDGNYNLDANGTLLIDAVTTGSAYYKVDPYGNYFKDDSGSHIRISADPLAQVKHYTLVGTSYELDENGLSYVSNGNFTFSEDTYAGKYHFKSVGTETNPSYSYSGDSGTYVFILDTKAGLPLYSQSGNTYVLDPANGTLVKTTIRGVDSYAKDPNAGLAHFAQSTAKQYNPSPRADSTYIAVVDPNTSADHYVINNGVYAKGSTVNGTYPKINDKYLLSTDQYATATHYTKSATTNAYTVSTDLSNQTANYYYAIDTDNISTLGTKLSMEGQMKTGLMLGNSKTLYDLYAALSQIVVMENECHQTVNGVPNTSYDENDITLLSDISKIALLAAPVANNNPYPLYPPTKDDAGHYQWKCVSSNCAGTTFNTEWSLYSDQFVDFASMLAHAVSQVPSTRRTADMTNFSSLMGPVLVDHYNKWLTDCTPTSTSSTSATGALSTSSVSTNNADNTITTTISVTQNTATTTIPLSRSATTTTTTVTHNCPAHPSQNTGIITTLGFGNNFTTYLNTNIKTSIANIIKKFDVSITPTTANPNPTPYDPLGLNDITAFKTLLAPYRNSPPPSILANVNLTDTTNPNKKLAEYVVQGIIMTYALDDKQMIIADGAINMLAAIAADSSSFNLEQRTLATMKSFVKNEENLMKSRSFQTTLTNFAGATVYGLDFDKGVWYYYPQDRYAKATDTSFTTPNPTYNRGIDPATSAAGVDPGGSWDVSHTATRWSYIMASMYEYNVSNKDTVSFPVKNDMDRLANQLAYVLPIRINPNQPLSSTATITTGSGTTAITKPYSKNFNFSQPIFGNYMNGNPGWFDVYFHTPVDGTDYAQCTGSGTFAAGYSFQSDCTYGARSGPGALTQYMIFGWGQMAKFGSARSINKSDVAGVKGLENVDFGNTSLKDLQILKLSVISLIDRAQLDLANKSNLDVSFCNINYMPGGCNLMFGNVLMSKLYANLLYLQKITIPPTAADLTCYPHQPNVYITPTGTSRNTTTYNITVSNNDTATHCKDVTDFAISVSGLTSGDSYVVTDPISKLTAGLNGRFHLSITPGTTTGVRHITVTATATSFSKKDGGGYGPPSRSRADANATTGSSDIYDLTVSPR